MGPKRLGRYELLEPLGEGGMGQVWLARLTGAHGFEKLCIVKTLLAGVAAQPQFVSRLFHEAKVMTQLQHANIAQVLDFGEEGGTYFLALEYVAGLDLSRLLAAVQAKAQRLSIPLATYLVQQVAEGLAFAHARTQADGTALNLVHRDISPHNVMLSWDGEVKVIDFGIARSEAKTHATATASVLGKLGYMAPEQARGLTLDHRADQYACAVMLWEMLADQPYVPRGTTNEMLVAMAHPSVRPLVPLRPDVPPSLEAALLKALAPEPAQRYPTTQDFARALLDELNRLGGVPSRAQVSEFVKSYCGADFDQHKTRLTRVSTLKPPPTAVLEAPMNPMNTNEMQKAIRPSRAPIAIAAVLVIGFVAGGAYWALKSDGPPAPAPKVDVPPPPAPLPPPPTPVPAEAAPATPPQAVPERKEAAAAPAIDVGRAIELFNDGDKTFARAGSDAKLSVGVSYDVVGAQSAPGKHPRVGSATVMEVFPQMARVSLDRQAQDAAGPRFLALGAAPTPAPPPPPAPTPTPVAAPPPPPPPPAADPSKPPAPDAPKAARVLKGNVRLQRTPVWSVFLTNTSSFGWSACTVVVPGQRRASLKSLPAGFDREFPLDSFQVDPSLPELGDTVEVRCAQGTLRVRATE